MAVGKKTGGRKKGSVNKATKDVIEKLEAIGCDPILGMAQIAAEAMTGTEKITSEGKKFKEKDLMLAGAMYRELAQYVAPKRKAIEHSGVNGSTIDVDTKFEIVFVEPEKFD